MFEATRLLFYYAVSPVHMGAGSAIGAIDNPIQREVHTEHPMFAGSGLKGAVRHRCTRAWRNGDDGAAKALVNRLFGPDTRAADHAGAVSFSDAQLVALPVRSLSGAFVYASSPLALGRLKRLASLAKLEVEWSVPPVDRNKALVAGTAALSGGRLVLEAFDFEPVAEGAGNIAEWLAKHSLPAGDAHEFFREKLRSDLVIVDDAAFAHFARQSMAVEPHVRINDDSGTADDGGLFFTENLPPESIMAGLVQASVERYKANGGDGDVPKESRYCDAEKVLDAVLSGPGDGRSGIAGSLLQIGGDATTGRGLVLVQPAGD